MLYCNIRVFLPERQRNERMAGPGGIWERNMTISYKLEKFEGPLDLLLHLIEKNKVDIYDIPIVEITKQYLDYVNQMEKEDLNIVSDFLVMAATHLDIKSRMLLPALETEEGEEEDPRAELVARLLEYKKYKIMAQELADMEEEAGDVLFKMPTVPKEVAKYEPPVDLDKLLDGLTLAKLQRIFDSVMRRQKEKIDPIRSKFGTIEKEEVSLSDKMIEIKDFARTHRKFSFRNLLESQCSKVQVIVTFLSILELMKMGHIHVEQDGLFDDISVEVQTDPDTWKNLTEFAEDEP